MENTTNIYGEEFKCNGCGKTFIVNEDNVPFFATHPISNKEHVFDSSSCLHSWATARLIAVGICLALGLVLTIMMFTGGQTFIAVECFFIPYMIRVAFIKLAKLFDGGTAGEILTLALVVLGAITIIYPLYKAIREIVYYCSLYKQ